MAYQFPLNGGRINASIGGNSTSAGAGYALVSTGTLHLMGGNNITLSQNGQSISVVGGGGGGGAALSAAGASASNGTVVFSNSNGVGFGMNGSTITASHNGITSQTNQTVGIYATGANTTGQSSSSTIDARSLNVSAMGGLYAGMSGNTLQLSAATTYAASNHSHGNPTLNLTNLSGTTGSASNGLTLSLSAAAQSAQTANLYVSSNSTQLSSTAGIDLRSVTLQGAGAASFGVSQGKVLLSAPEQSSLSHTGAVSISRNGNTISIGAPVQTNQTIGISATSNTFSSSNGTVDARSLYLRGVGNASVGISNGSILVSGGAGGGGVALSASNSVFTSGTVQLSNAGGALTIGTAAQQVNFSVPATSSISATGAVSISINGSTVSIGAPAVSMGASTGGNTAGNTGTVSNQLIFAGGNNITLSQTTGAGGATMSIIGGAGGGNTANFYVSSNSTQLSSTAGVDIRSLTFQGAGNVSVGVSQGKVLISGAGGAGGGVAISGGGTSYSNGTVNLSNHGGALTISGSTNSVLSISVPAQSNLSATGGVSMSSNGSTISIGAPLAGTISNWEPRPFAEGSVTFSSSMMNNGTLYFHRLQPQAYISASQMVQLVSLSISTVANSSHAGVISLYAGIYTANGSTLSLITQSSGSTAHQWTNTSNNSLASISGLRGLTVPLNISMSPGNYWIGLISRTASTNQNWFTISNAAFTHQTNMTFQGIVGQASNATQGLHEAVGYYSASSAALPSSAAMSHITQTNQRSNLVPYMAFKNMAW